MKIRPSSSSSQWYPHPHHHPHGHRHPHHHPHYHSNWAMKDSQKLAPNHPNHTLLLRWEQKLVKFYHQPFSRPKLAQSGGPSSPVAFIFEHLGLLPSSSQQKRENAHQGWQNPTPQKHGNTYSTGSRNHGDTAKYTSYFMLYIAPFQ